MNHFGCTILADLVVTSVFAYQKEQFAISQQTEYEKFTNLIGQQFESSPQYADFLEKLDSAQPAFFTVLVQFFF